MEKIILLFCALTFVVESHAQDLDLIVGRNFTVYDYTNSQGEENPDLSGASGSYYALTYSIPFNAKSADLYYFFGLALNQFNATGGDYASSYRWDTNYLGIKSGIKYVFTNPSSFIRAGVKTGFGISRIINGQQKINGTTFDLTKEDEFTAVSVEPFIGVEARYFVTDRIGLGLGYSYSKSFGVANSDTEKLNFNNSRLEFGVTFQVY
jgi:hypothetical protein